MMLTKLNIRGVLLPRVTRYLSTSSIICQDHGHKTPRKIRIKQEKNREIEQEPARPRQKDLGTRTNYRSYRIPDQEEEREMRIPFGMKVILAILFNPLSLLLYLSIYEAGPKELLDAIIEEYQDWKDKR